MDDELKYVPMNILQWRFDEEGNTKEVTVGFQASVGGESINSRILLTIEDVKSVNESWNFNNLDKNRSDIVARRKLRDLIMADKPVEKPPAE